MSGDRLARGFPLLARELIEQAARRQTYRLRVVYALLLFLASIALFSDELTQMSTDPYAVLGHGRRLFETVVQLQFIGIYAFAPALAASAFTYEKERNSLGLLFLTRLSPWTIVFEKYLSRLVPLASFLLLSLPLLAIAYMLGGISVDYLLSGIWLLGVAALQVCAIAFVASAYVHTTVTAFIATYPLALVLTLIAYPPPVLFGHAQQQTFPMIVAGSMPALLLTVFCLFAARHFLVSRAFVLPRNPLLRIFRALDAFFLQLNDRLAHGILLVAETSKLPEDEPVAWRETTKRSFGTARYLFRILAMLEAPAIFVMQWTSGMHPGNSAGAVTGVIVVLWIISALLLCVWATNVVSSERTRETLDVLLSTPMTGREIVQQKFRALRRMMLVLAVPLVTLMACQLYTRMAINSFRPLQYGVVSLLTLAIYLPLIAWGSLWIGLRVRRQSYAVFVALGALIVVCVVPIVAAKLLAAFYRPTEPFWGVDVYSPVALIASNEAARGNAPFSPYFVHFVIYGGLLWSVRALCLNRADAYLGRHEGSSVDRRPPRAWLEENDDARPSLASRVADPVGDTSPA